MITPGSVSKKLRHIAARIDASKSPDPNLVSKEIKKVLSSLQRSEAISRIAHEIFRLAQEDIELTAWDTEEGADVKSAWNMAIKENKDEKIVPALNSLLSDVKTMVDSIRSGESSTSDDDDVVTSAPPRRSV